MKLQASIRELAETFANRVLDAIRSSPLDEILAGAGTGPARGRPAGPPPQRNTRARQVSAPRTRGGRRARRGATDVAQVVGRIVELLKGHPEGLRAEHLRAKLGLERPALGRPIADALSSKQITKRGEKRATTYFVGSARTAARVAKAPARKSASRPANGAKARADAPAKRSEKSRPKKRRGADVVLSESGKAAEQGKVLPKAE